MARRTEIVAVKKKAKKKAEPEVVQEFPERQYEAAKRGPVKASKEEMRDVISTTLQRLEYFGYMADDREVKLNSDELAKWLVVAMLHGYTTDGRVDSSDPVVNKVQDHEYDEIPLCKEHR